MPDLTTSLPDALAVVTIDRLPAWMLPTYGSTWVAMPNLDALAGRGIVFDRVLATTDDVAITLEALAGAEPRTTASPRLPAMAFARDGGSTMALITDDANLASVAQAPTATCFVAPGTMIAPATSEAETILGRLFASATATVQAAKHRVVWCHASSLGVAWDAPESYRDRYLDPDDPPPPAGARVPSMDVDNETDPDTLVGIRHVFAGQLTLLDRCLGVLLEAIAKRTERWLIIVAGTRGLGLGLHGIVGCEPMQPMSEVLQLPAILVDHRQRMAGQRYGGLVTAQDLGATLADLLGSATEPSTDPRHGQSLAGLLQCWRAPDRDRIIARTDRGVAVITPSWHLVQPTEQRAGAAPARLFAKPDDFFEACDVANRCPAVAEELSTLARGDLEQAWLTPLSRAALAGL